MTGEAGTVLASPLAANPVKNKSQDRRRYTQMAKVYYDKDANMALVKNKTIAIIG